MDVIVNFGYRSYLFHSQEDVTKATSIYAHNTGCLDEFEMELDDLDMIYEYNFDG